MYRRIIALVSSNMSFSIIMFVRTILFARLLSAADFGIASTLLTSVAIMRLISDIGLDKLIVQHDSGDSVDFQRGLQFFQVLRGLLNACVLFLLAWPLAIFLGQPDLVWAYQAMAVVPLCGAFTHLDAKRLQRKMRYGPQIAVTLLPPLLSLLMIWPLAQFFTDYRLVLLTITSAAVFQLTISHVVAERPYRIGYDRSVLKQGFSFGWPLLLDGIMLFAIFHGEKLVVGRELGMAVLGIFSLGLTLMQSPGGSVSSALSQFFLPQLAAQKAHSGHFTRIATIALQSYILAALALCVGVLLLGEPIVRLAFGEKYAALVPFLTWFAIMQSLRITKNGTAMISVARAKTGNGLVGNIPRVLAVFFAWYYLTLGHGLSTVMVCGVLGEFAGFLLTLVLLKQRADVSLRSARFSLVTYIGFLFVFGIHGALQIPAVDMPTAITSEHWPITISVIIIVMAALCVASMRQLWNYLRNREASAYN